VQRRGFLWWLSTLATALGCALLLAEALWISYGVFARYILRSPDSFVTEGSALLLLGLAFAGLSYALREGSFPRVTFLLDQLSPARRAQLDLVNMALMAAIGGYFALATIRATATTFRTGQTTMINEWPEWLAWLPAAIFTSVFTLDACAEMMRMARAMRGGRRQVAASR
jgi:TRAP-type C4-dicarboxylate transport system permease small subunit